jgi:O-antigen ligase
MNTIAYATIWLLVFSISSEPTFRGFGVVGSQLTGVLALGFAMVAFAASGRVRRLHPVHVAAFLFVTWTGFSVVFIHNGWMQIPNKFWTFVSLVAMLWMIWELAVTRDRQLGLMAAYVFGAYTAALDTILLWRREGEMMRRFSAGGVDNNDLAMILVMAIPMAWYLSMTVRKPVLRLLYSAYVPCAVLAIGLTGSRGGMVTTLVALLFIPLTVSKLSPFRRGVAIALLWISGLVAVTYLPQTLMERLASTRTEVEGGNMGGRMKIWKAGVRAWAARPWTGYGTASFIRAVDPYLATRAQVAHNSFLSVAVEEGLVGLILYLIMFFLVFQAVRTLPKTERRFALVLLAALMVSMLPLTADASKRVWTVLAILVGMSQSRIVRKPVAARRRQPLPAGPPPGWPGRRPPIGAPVRRSDTQ